jgi:hypothetical protein
MRRIVVVGGLGFFGGLAVQRLRADGAQPLTAARRPGADLKIDVEDPGSLRAVLRPGDVVVDTVGPFQDRTLALLDAALEIGFDLVDIADSRAYVARLYARQPQIDASGLRVLTACSSISAISATLVRSSALESPVRVTGFLAPAARFAANPGSGASLLRSVGHPIGVLRDGQQVTLLGWRESRTLSMPPPIGLARGYLYETADPVTLPRIWPSLRTVEFYVDSRVPGLNLAFSLVARSAALRRVVARFMRPGLAVARALGSTIGCLAFEIEASGGQLARYALIGSNYGHFTPIAPAVLAARAIADGRFQPVGLVPAHRYVEPDELLGYLRALGIATIRPA